MINFALHGLCTKPVLKHLCTEKMQYGSDLLQKFDDHVQSYGLGFGTQDERRFRLELFAEKDTLISKTNFQEAAFQLGHNQFSTFTDAEYKQWLNDSVQQPNDDVTINAIEQPSTPPKQVQDLPDSVDWRTKGAIPAVKNQGQCGSALGFSQFDSLQAYYFIKSGGWKDLSFTQYWDCTDKGKECARAGNATVFDYATEKGFMLDADYPKSSPPVCHYDASKVKVKVTEVKQVAKNSKDAIKQALVNGPVNVLVQGSSSVFQMYRSGILDSDKCGTMLDHGLLAIGYGTEKGVEYFILRNSWGSSWGDKGYIRMSAKDGPGICGMNQIAAYPDIELTMPEPELVVPKDEPLPCFEWNRHMWLGTKPTHTFFTRCGREKCIDCLSGEECYEFDTKMWMGAAPASTVAKTECGQENCTPCPNVVQ